VSDEDLLIGGGKKEEPPQPEAYQTSSKIATPAEMVSISVFGVYPDDTAIEQQFKLNKPRGTPDDQIALFVWDQVSKLGGLTVTGAAGEYNFFPLSLFKRITLKLGIVVGVTL